MPKGTYGGVRGGSNFPLLDLYEKLEERSNSGSTFVLLAVQKKC
jgi:hypothetical protein